MFTLPPLLVDTEAHHTTTHHKHPAFRPPDLKRKPGPRRWLAVSRPERPPDSAHFWSYENNTHTQQRLAYNACDRIRYSYRLLGPYQLKAPIEVIVYPVVVYMQLSGVQQDVDAKLLTSGLLQTPDGLNVYGLYEGPWAV
ncbi:hypothetical protein Pmani_014388 [Petrolisthes manimaculis]|uniref:Uncharacterized protein n=1 Tax=Petrolisthes manimaculis TaxID=1843537 RepID=A0AAE1PVJ2_9EUCA|nr:hypothetical protein Pmani_014388 [Petrolisthes manimaculis]